MKAAFFNNNKEIVDTVYSKEIKEKLFNELDFYPEVITYNELKNKKDVTISLDVIFTTWGMPRLTEEEIKEYFPTLKVVFYGAGSVQHFAREFINSNVKVSSAWAANATPVAEYTVAQIILANKGFFQSTLKMKNKIHTRDYNNSFPCNYDVNVGLLGAGSIGTRVANLLKNYKMNIYVFDPFLSDERAKELGVEKCDLEYIFKNCQTISNHLANNEQTKNMLNYNLFKLMKDNATFINTGRGAQVVEEDLVKFLKEKPDATAILDVTDPEPPISSHEFYTLDNVILTPHIAGSIENEKLRLGEFMYDEFCLYKKGEIMQYEVTLKMLETMA